MEDAVNHSKDTINDQTQTLHEKKQKDLLIDFNGQANDDLLNSQREAEKNEEEEVEEKSFYLTAPILMREWGKDYESLPKIYNNKDIM